MNQWEKKVRVDLTLKELAVINAVFAEETTAGTIIKVDQLYKGINIGLGKDDLSYSIYRDSKAILRRHLNEGEGY